MNLTEQLWNLKQLYSNGSYYDPKKNIYLHHIPSNFPPENLEELKRLHRLPNQILYLEHDETILKLRRLADEWTLREAGEAFIAGLWSAPFLWRTALTAKLIADVMPEHEHVPYSDFSNTCMVCGFGDWAVDTSLVWYRLMTGGIPLDGEPVGHVLALMEMKKMGKRPMPNAYDLWTFRAILTVIRNLPPKTTYSKVRDILHQEKLLPTTRKGNYCSLLESLALIGILDTKEYSGMATKFTSYAKRDERPSTRIEPQAPLAWWNSSIGINEATLKKVFAGIDTSAVSLTERPEPIPPLLETITGGLEKKRMPRRIVPRSPDAGVGPAQAGDVYAVRIRDDMWVTSYCHRVEGGRAVMEFMDGIFKEMPMKEQLKHTFRPRRDGRSLDRISGIDKTVGVKRVARQIPVPFTDLPEPKRIPLAAASDLKYLAHWNLPEVD